MEPKNLHLRHFATNLLRFLPIYSAAAAGIMAILLSINDLHPFLPASGIKVFFEIAVITAGFLLVFCFSVIFGFCRSHRFGIFYTYIFLVCLWIFRYSGALSQYVSHYALHLHTVFAITGFIYIIHIIASKCHIPHV